ncbi:Transcription repressor OFP7 [Striga hermonthica]|uniref:Transcription repressor n=1 Tax=Striga hermonthica TaxID=68872 RepID=A0A9N7RPR0_STRHE|nr:Transcription repressor OFP7 [Striga hermonthica]
MAKRFKLRISRAIAATLQSCRSKDPSNLPENPIPSLPKSLTTAIFRNPTRRLPSAAFISIGAAACDTGDDRHREFKWRKEEEWHVFASICEEQPLPRLKICSSPEDGPQSPPPPPPPPPERRGRGGKKNPVARRRKKKNKKKVKHSRIRASTSSADSSWFSSEIAAAGERDDEEETETLVSTFSTDSSVSTGRRDRKRRGPKRGRRAAAAEAEIPARLSVLKRLIPCTVEGKVKESFAVVKRSADPYEDFKSSMMDMILEKQMFDPTDLEQLLECFLSLNSRRYHWVIVQAFSEIWEALFAEFPVQDGRRRSNASFRMA